MVLERKEIILDRNLCGSCNLSSVIVNVYIVMSKINQYYTWEEIKKFIDDIVEYAANNTFSIEFLGEPLLSFDL